MSVLLDASVWLAAADRDDQFHEAASRLLRSPTVEHAALDLTVYEVGNVATVRWRDPELGQRLCRAVLAASEDRLVRIDPDLVAEAVELADREGITVYDAAYVATARRESHVLVSGDVRDLVGRGLAVAPDAVDT